MRLASESAEEEETSDAKVEAERGVPHSLRRRRKFVAALKLSAEARERTEIEERGFSIQKARRKRTHDYPARRCRLYKESIAIVHVSSCNDVLALHKMSIATFHIELGLHSMCMSRLYTLYTSCCVLHPPCACRVSDQPANRSILERL